MKEQNWFRRFMQYGYDTDVFDKFRDAVARYNRDALKVLGPAGVLTGLTVLVLLIVSQGSGDGIALAALLLIAGCAGIVGWFRRPATPCAPRSMPWRFSAAPRCRKTCSGSARIWP